MSERLVILIVSLLIIADLTTGLLFNLNFSFYRVGVFAKSLILVFTLIICLPLIRKKSLLSIYAVLLVLFIFWLIAALISLVKNPQFELGYSLIVLSRYLLFLILACAFANLANSSTFEEKCKKIFEGFFLANNLFILAGFIFSIQLFSSYNPQGDITVDARFGYKGLIYGTNEIAGIYILGIAYFYRENFKYGNDKKWKLMLTCLAALLTGTKATLIGLAILTPYYFIKYRVKTFILLLIPFFLTLIYLTTKHWEYLKEKYLSFNMHTFESLDLITFLMSGRNLYVVKNLNYIKTDWTFVNYITGDAFLYSETDLLDLFFFFGMGCTLYLFIYVKVFFIKDKSRDNMFNFILLMAIAFTAGHIIQSAVVPIFLLLYVFSGRKTNG